MGAVVTAVELLPPAEATPDNERWHELRRTGITASEIAAVLGISPWESPFSLYWRKVNGWRLDDNDLLSAGRHLEDAIARWWWNDVPPVPGYYLRPAGLYAHQDRPWQLATPDRLVMEKANGGETMAALLECKWVAYSWDGWGEPGTDDVPVYYRAQALWQADVLGVDEVHIAALGPGGFRAYLVRRDETDLEVMRTAGAEFARRLADLDPPPLDSHTATLGALKRLHPSVGEGEVEVEKELAFRYRHARDQRKKAEDEIALCEAQIRADLGSEYARATFDGGRLLASRSVYETSRIDVARLRAEMPDVAEKYTTTTTVDRLNPARSKP